MVCEHLWISHYVDSLKIHAFVLMPNHFHLVASVQEGPIYVPLMRFLRESSRSFNFYSNHVDQNWGGRHYKCEIIGYQNFLNVYKYVYQNPVRAKLCLAPETWPYSTLHGLVGASPLQVPMVEDTLLFQQNSINWSTLKWLNQGIKAEDLCDVRSGLKKRIFKLPQTPNRKPHRLEKQRI